MKAMVLAAGFGTRLGELGRTTPKCLVEAGGKTMLEHVLARLAAAGVTSVVINLHHLGGSIEQFIRSKPDLGIEVLFSHEATILGTGGGVKHARALLDDASEFFVHNGDIYSEFNLRELLQEHRSRQALATLAVMRRSTSRPLYFDSDMQLVGWQGGSGERGMVREDPGALPLAFSGIQIISPEIFEVMEKFEGEFSIIAAYMEAARRGARVRGAEFNPDSWMDIGTPERLAELRGRLKLG